MLGAVLHYIVVTIGSIWAQAQFGLDISPTLPTGRDLIVMASVFTAGVLAGCLPAWRAYRQSLADGMVQRI
jgi:putative ABC transport system permease protein